MSRTSEIVRYAMIHSYLFNQHDADPVFAETINKFKTQMLDKIRRAKNICIDGSSCTGKTTIVKKFKFNHKIPFECNVNELWYQSYKYNKKNLLFCRNNKGYALDRSVFSNFVYLIVNEVAKRTNYKIVDDMVDILERVFVDFKLDKTFVHLMSVIQSHRFKYCDIIFIVNSDVEDCILMRTNRKRNDNFKECTRPILIMLENLCFTFVARKLGCILIDLNLTSKKLTIDKFELLDKLQEIIQVHLMLNNLGEIVQIDK